jgi:sugar/nucleoside kinase (ribokinase family)
MLKMDYVAFGLILDDIAFADGRVASGVLGGGGPQTAFGMRLWSERVGLVARVGADLRTEAWDWLRSAGVDTAGVNVTPWPTLRALQRLDAVGHRSHEWRVPADTIGAQLARTVADLPSGYRGARGFHVGLHPDEPDLAFLAGLRALGGLVSVEPFRRAAQRPALTALRALLEACDVFSPNLAGAESLVGSGPPEVLAQRLSDAGARVVALRLGAEGSLVLAPAEGRGADRLIHIPAIDVNLVDPVGAGNAYCGAFLTGWAESHDALEAGLRGAVAASFVLEQVGLPQINPTLLAHAQERYVSLRRAIPPGD